MKKKSVFAAVCLLLVLAANCACASGISIPNNTTVIGERAFYGDRSITEVELPEGVARIEKEAFADTSLQSILLPMSLKYFARDAFAGCPDRLEIWVHKNSAAWTLCHTYGLDDKIREMPPPTTAKKVGISMPTNDLQRWANDGALMKSALTELGYDVDLQYASNDIATQVTQIENMIGSGCHMLVIASIDGDSLGAVLGQAKEKDIPVLAYDRLIMNTDAVTYYVTFDSYMIGQMQGQSIIDQLELDSTDGPYTIEFTAGDPEDENACRFFDGAMDILEPYIEQDKLNVKSGQTGFDAVATDSWASEKAQERAATILAEHYADGMGPDAWVCSNDSLALGIIRALESYYTGSWPVITGQDCDLENVRCILNDKQSMSVFKDTRFMAEKAAEMVNAALLGLEVPINDTKSYDNNVMIIPTFLCDPIVVDKDNYYEILIDGGFYREEDLAPSPTTEKRVGISLPTKDLQRWDTEGAFMASALTKLGYSVVLDYASNDIATQVTQIENMIGSGCHMLVIAPIDGDSLGTVLDQAKEKNIPVLAYDRLIMNSDALTCYVTFGSYRIGKMQGEYIRDQLQLYTTDGPYNIELTAGDPGDENARRLFEGAMDVLNPYIDEGKLRVKSGQTDFKEVMTAGWAPEAAQSCADAILSANYADSTALDAWLCSNDSLALGIIRSLESNYTGSWPVVTGQDCDLQNVKYMINGKQSMSVFKDTRILAEKAAEMVNAALLGQDVPVNDTETFNNNVMIIPTFLCDPVIVDKDNCRKILVDGGFYREEDLM